MSNSLLTVALLDSIREAVLSAWGSMPVSYGPPRTPIVGTPYAVIDWRSVEISFDGLGASAGKTSQLNRFVVLGRFPFPDDPTQIVSLQRAARASDIIGQLQTGAEFASIGLMPLVTKVDGSEPADPNERTYIVSIEFEVVTIADHS
ncbi:MAG: hypothetical protein P4L46_17510 [Fimbriimonas sp.]|nr:hypothetical protein [Fimbriimonas sp.]